MTNNKKIVLGAGADQTPMATAGEQVADLLHSYVNLDVTAGERVALTGEFQAAAKGAAGC